MLEFSDAPYRFFDARPSAPVICLGRSLNRFSFLPWPKHLIRDLFIDGELEALKEAQSNGNRLLFVINHPSHSNPQVMTEVQRRLHVDACFMAAYDVFLRSKLTAWGMQKMGNFSIDCEGNDRKAMATAINIMVEGKKALNIFAEGNVYLTNDRATPFLDGAAFISLKAQAVAKNGVKIIPVSLKFSHLTSPRDAITKRMLQLGNDCGHEFPAGSSENPVKAVFGLGKHILSLHLQKHGFKENLHENDTSLFAVLETFAGELITEVERKLQIFHSEAFPLITRIAKTRTKIHQFRTDTSIDTDTEIALLADRAILALRIHGYLAPYLRELPTIDRYDETVERISEDFYSRTMPRTGPRRAMVIIGAPIDVCEFSDMKLREALPLLTEKMQRSVQAGVDVLNEYNDAPGSQLLHG